MVKSGKYITFVKVAEVAEDWSGWLLEDWMKYGFRECEWSYAYEDWQDKKKWDEMGKKCPVCYALDGQRFKIQDVLDKSTHSAPKYTLAHVGCFSKDTEIYTEEGFKLVKDVKVGEQVLSLNPKTLDLDWVKIIDTVSYIQDKMIRFYNKTLDLMVTPNHRMFYFTDWTRSKGEKGKFIEAEKLSPVAYFYRSSEWKGKKYRQSMFGLKIEDFCKFMGYYLSEGSISRNVNQIMITQFNKEKKEQMWNDLKNMKFKTVSNVKQGIYIRSPKLFEYLKQFGKCNEKYVPKEIKELPAVHIRTFLDAFRLGDGSTIKTDRKFHGYKMKDRYTYWTSSKKMADDLGELIIKVGKRPCYYLAKRKGKLQHFKNGDYVINNDTWTISESATTYSGGYNGQIKRDIVNYNDSVYCVELEKYNTLLVRRNNKVVWSGNCKCKFKRIPREQEQLDYAEVAKEETQAPVEAPVKADRLSDIGWGDLEMDIAIKDLFTRNKVDVDQSEIDSIIQEVKEYSEGLSMKSKSNSYDQIWRAIQRSTWKKLKEKNVKASLMTFIKTAKETKMEMLKW